MVSFFATDSFSNFNSFREFSGPLLVEGWHPGRDDMVRLWSSTRFSPHAGISGVKITKNLSEDDARDEIL